MRILLVGSGAREHAIAAAIASSPRCACLVAAPGNPGIAAVARCVPVSASDVEGLVALARAERVDLVVVGPEAPLVLGLVDRLAAIGIRAFGPAAAAARLEGSKKFLKDLCARHRIPTAGYEAFTDADAAAAYVRSHGAPVVVKADGLAAGKGVTVASTVPEALDAVDEALRRHRFGEAGATVIVEDFLTGPEMSLFVLARGETATPLATAMDYKRAGDGGTGPNTGGMGAITPHPLETPALLAEVMATIVEPTLRAMRTEGAPFEGILYAGLMLTPDGPRLLEYNVRFGDPECQAILARLRGDLLDVIDPDGAASEPARFDGAAACVVLTAPGYPGDAAVGDAIGGIEAAEAHGARVFHAATRRDEAGALRSSGGRVLSVVARARNVEEASRAAYDAVARIEWPGARFRRDIGVWKEPRGE